MALKLNPQGLLIYITMALYLAAFVLLFARKRKAGIGCYAAGFVVASASFAYRWWHVGHVPLQNMFEVFLCLGMMSYPISFFARRFLNVGGQSADALTGFIALFPAGFVFKAELQKLPPALQSWLFIPHVAAYMLAYMILFKATGQAAGQLFRGAASAEAGLIPREQATYRVVRFGFPLLTLGLLLGAVWGKLAWGNYWNWDPKELWSLVTWLVFLVYLHFRYVFGARYPRVNALLVCAGSVAIVLTLLWVNLASRLFPGMHTYS